MSRSLAVCLSGLALVAASPGLPSAQIEPPHLKPGLWQDRMDMGGVAMNMQMCMDESVESRAAAFRPPMQGGAAAAQACSQRDMKPIPGGFQVDTTCTVRGRPTHTSMTMIGDFQSGYKMDMTMTPDGGSAVRMSMVARWAGPCPADMKPGQVVTNMDMNGLGAAAAAIAAARRSGAPAETDAH